MIMEKEMKFEEAMARLSKVVQTIESGEATLDESIALFEEGMKLSKYCADILEKAEQKVQFLQEEAKNEQNADE